jgi:hypothetical protein
MQRGLNQVLIVPDGLAPDGKGDRVSPAFWGLGELDPAGASPPIELSRVQVDVDDMPELMPDKPVGAMDRHPQGLLGQLQDTAPALFRGPDHRVPAG